MDKNYIGSDLQVVELPPCIHGIVYSISFLPSVITVTTDDIRLKTVLTVEPNAPTLEFSPQNTFFSYNSWIYKKIIKTLELYL